MAPGCAQANELELALDVYGQLLREGCTPNLVTYNILIDVHGKMGNWQEAGQVLDALESQVRASLIGRVRPRIPCVHAVPFRWRAPCSAWHEDGAARALRWGG